MTVLVYLNDGEEDFKGGWTCFLDYKEDDYQKSSRNESKANILHAVVPKPGRVLVFDHNVFHVGEDVTSGTKVCIRTDVMFQLKKIDFVDE